MRISISVAFALLTALMGNTAVAQEVTPLAGMLKILATGGDDDAYSNVIGVTWDGYDVADNGTDSGNQNFIRNGRLLLAGFADRNDMPKGAGADATTVKGNEGEAMVTIAGFTMGPVYSVRVQKFFASEDYAEVLERQLPAGATLTPVASDCALNEDGKEGDDSKSAFFRVELGEGDPVFTRASISEGMKDTPELTLFEFSNEESDYLVEKMKCNVK